MQQSDGDSKSNRLLTLNVLATTEETSQFRRSAFRISKELHMFSRKPAVHSKTLLLELQRSRC